jgi:hypothetical protein
LQTRLEYLLQRLKERMGERALTEVIEQLYNLAIIEKEPPSSLILRLKNRRGRRSKIEKYLKHPEGLNTLEEDLRQGRISRATYFRAKKKMKRSF